MSSLSEVEGSAVSYLQLAQFHDQDNASCVANISFRMTQPQKHDSDTAKGAVEQEKPQPHTDNPYTHGQLGHRDQNEDLKDNDTDFPEPGARRRTHRRE